MGCSGTKEHTLDGRPRHIKFPVYVAYFGIIKKKNHNREPKRPRWTRKLIWTKGDHVKPKFRIEQTTQGAK